ncbi:hypothetical protein [Pseudolabrys taiwanensis]|uniref:hypothetical protein n=1 Tax=Pseudolabrys taiwanensis TaxID=331696 RepID=UPI0013B3BB25|nr:hypothetical protein [Pseudolabrys taiwanensis]
MKLARTPFVVVRNDDSRREVRHPRRPTHARAPAFTIVPRPVPLRLAAAWHLDPRTQRLVCAWSMEADVADEPISRSPCYGRRGGAAATVTQRIHNRGVLPAINAGRARRAPDRGR